MTATGDVDNALFEALFENALKPTHALDVELARAGYDRQKPVGRYPGPVLVACLQAAARVLQPGVPEPEAFRVFGRSFVEGFRRTILGKVATTALPILGPARFLPRLPGRFAAIRGDATVSVVVQDRHADITFVDPLPLGPFFAGVLEVALKLSGATAPRIDLHPNTVGYVLEAHW